MHVSFYDLSDYTKELVDESRNRQKNPGRKLIASHVQQTEYLVALELLQVLMQHGLEVTKLHKVIRFRQEACFENFI